MVMPDKVMIAGLKHLKRINAERRAGEMLGKRNKAKGGQPYHNSTSDKLSLVETNKD